jgi:hypothetical protein
MTLALLGLVNSAVKKPPRRIEDPRPSTESISCAPLLFRDLLLVSSPLEAQFKPHWPFDWTVEHSITKPLAQSYPSSSVEYNGRQQKRRRRSWWKA